MSIFTTKATRTKGGYFCRVSIKGVPAVQTKVASRQEIGPAFRDLLRTMDKCGGDEFTKAARYRAWKEGNRATRVKHDWL